MENTEEKENEKTFKIQSEFFLKEYETLWKSKERINIRQMQLGKIFLTTIATFVAFNIAIKRFAETYLLYSILISSSLAFLISLFMYVAAVSSMISFTFHIKAINNVRKYFSELLPSNSKYLSFPKVNKAPKPYTLSFHCIIYSICCATFSYVFMFSLLRHFKVSNIISLSSCLIPFAIILYINYKIFRLLHAKRTRG